MRTNIEIDDELMTKALELTGLPSKRAAVEEGLRLLVQRAYRQQMLDAAGKREYGARHEVEIQHRDQDIGVEHRP